MERDDTWHYSQRLELSTAADELSPGLTELTALAMQRLTFDDLLHGDVERDLDLPRLLQHTVTSPLTSQWVSE